MTLEQQRALMAHAHMEQVQTFAKEAWTLYGSMAQKLPVLIRTAGLCQALHFIRSRKEAILQDLLLRHLAEQLQRVDPNLTIDPVDLLKQVRKAALGKYLWLSREAMATAEWYSRLSQSELNVSRDAEIRA